jgi:hypothetical protein
MTPTRIIATFENAADGVRSYVAQITNGYSVSLQDTDSGEFVGVSIVFQTLEKTVAKAKQIVSEN